MNRALPMLLVLLVALQLAVGGAAPARALSAKEAADGDELADLRIVPLDRALAPDLVMRSRPFVIDPNAAAFCFCTPTPRPIGEEAARRRLERFLNNRGLGDDAIAAALDRFDAPQTRRLIPPPTLRAAVLMLSAWDPYRATMAAILDGANPSGRPFATVTFERNRVPNAVATLTQDREGRFRLIVDPAYAGELPEQLIPVVVHEALHGGGPNSADEELIANILDTVAYAEVLLVDPTVAEAGTDLAIFNNAQTLALLNSVGRAGPGQLGIASSLLGDVWLLPGADEFDAASIRDAIEADAFYATLPATGSPGQRALKALLARFPGVDRLGEQPGFDEATLTVIDRGVGAILDPVDVVALAHAFELNLTAGVAEGPTPLPLPTDVDAAWSGRPFVPLDDSLFDPVQAVAHPLPRDETAARRELAAALDRRGVIGDAHTSLLTGFDDPVVRERIPHPALRAAALLLGAWNPWGSTLDDLLGGDNPDGTPLALRFADLAFGVPIVRQPAWPDGARPPALLLNRDLAGEAPELLASYIVQGTLLRVERPAADEAIVAALFGTLVYGELVALDPGLAARQTTATIARNRDLLALLNSGPQATENGEAAASTIGFLAAPAGVGDILPGLYADAASFASYVTANNAHADDTPPNTPEAPPAFAKYLRYAGIAPQTMQTGVFTFDRATLRDLDLGLVAFLTPSEALVLARALRLGIAAPCPRSAGRREHPRPPSAHRAGTTAPFPTPKR